MKLVKNFIAIALLAIVALTGCSKGQKLDKLSAVQKAGKLIIGCSADYPPYEFHRELNGKDAIVGFDIAIAQELAKDLGVTLEIKDMQFDGLLAALQAGTIDIIISGMTPTDERRKSVDFTTTYYFAEHGVIVRGGDKDKYATVDALKTAKLSAQKSTIQVGIAKKQILGLSEEQAKVESSQIKEVGSIKNLILDLKSGNVDAIVAELPVARAYVANNADLALAAPTFKDADGGSAIAVKRGGETFVAAMNTTISRLISEGKISQFVTEATELTGN